MSAKEREMAHILAREDRMDRFQTIMNLIKPTVFLILDLGCGIGSLASLLANEFPSASIVGIDKSKYLLEDLKMKRMKPNTSIIQADALYLPLRPGSFDLVVAVQVVHEIFHFRGEQELMETIKHVYNLLQKGGAFIVLDHANPGNATVSIRLSKDLFEKLRSFKMRFKPRNISYEVLDEEWARLSVRDFYDFVTKIWALDTNLEEEEMYETHTPFTPQEFARLCKKAGFKISHLSNLTSIDKYTDHYKIDVKTSFRLPGRHFIILAQK